MTGRRPKPVTLHGHLGGLAEHVDVSEPLADLVPTRERVVARTGPV
jgi:hypothetical protein